MEWFVSIITVCGLITGVYSFVKVSKARGAAELILAVLCPVITILFGALQDVRAFGGTRWAFFVHSATVDGDPWPWVLLVLLILEIFCIGRAVRRIAGR